MTLEDAFTRLWLCAVRKDGVMVAWSTFHANKEIAAAHAETINRDPPIGPFFGRYTAETMAYVRENRLRRLLAAWDHDRVGNTMRAGLVVVNEFNALRKELEADQ